MLFSAIIDGSTVPIPPPSSVKPDADVTTTDVPTSSTVAPTTTGMIFFYCNLLVDSRGSNIYLKTVRSAFQI